MDLRLCHASSRSEGPCLDSAYDVLRELIPRQVVDEGAGTRVVGANDGAEEGFDLVQTSFESEDVSVTKHDDEHAC